jgi:hypothetical protein
MRPPCTQFLSIHRVCQCTSSRPRRC